MKFRKKPVVIEAFRLGLDNIPDWFMDKVSTNEIILHGGWGDLKTADIKTLEGTMTAVKGEYIIRGIKGELYSCKPDIFAATYEPVGDSAQPHLQLECARCHRPVEAVVAPDGGGLGICLECDRAAPSAQPEPTEAERMYVCLKCGAESWRVPSTKLTRCDRGECSGQIVANPRRG